MTDLELLLYEVEAGWENGNAKHGVGGCLFVVMSRMIDNNGANNRTRRIYDMVTALGFTRSSVPHLPSLWEWNDEQADVEAVKKRIATALYYPGHYAVSA